MLQDSGTESARSIWRSLLRENSGGWKQNLDERRGHNDEMVTVCSYDGTVCSESFSCSSIPASYRRSLRRDHATGYWGIAASALDI